MPLLPGNSPDVIAHNIREMVGAGHPEKVAVAAAYANSRRHGDGEKHIAKAKRPSLPPGHPFNNHRAPDNRKRIAPFAAADHPGRDFRGEKAVNGVKMRT